MDSEQFKDIVLPHHRLMFRIALRVCGNTDDAQDAVQDAVVKLWSRRAELRNVDNMSGYLSSMSRNAAVDLLRKRRQSVDIEEACEIDNGSHDMAGAIDQRDRVKCVLGLIENLPDAQRTVITMRDVDGCEMAEISTVTGLSETNVRQVLSRARRAIRKYFD